MLGIQLVLFPITEDVPEVAQEEKQTDKQKAYEEFKAAVKENCWSCKAILLAWGKYVKATNHSIERSKDED